MIKAEPSCLPPEVNWPAKELSKLQDETTASRISKVEIGQGVSSKEINQYHCCPGWSCGFAPR